MCKTTIIEFNNEDIEFIHYVITQLRDRLYRESYYYYTKTIPDKRKVEYDRCNNILEKLVIAHEKVND